MAFSPWCYSRAFELVRGSGGQHANQGLGGRHHFGAFFLTSLLLPFLEIEPSSVLWIFGILLAGFISCLHSIAFGISLLFYLKMAAWMAAFLLGSGLGRIRGLPEIFVPLFLVSGLALCALGYGFLISAGEGGNSMTSTFYQSDVLAGYFLLVIPVASSVAVFSSTVPRAFLYGASALLLILSLFLTNSRGAILVFGIQFLAWSVFIYRKKPRALSYVVGGFIFSVFLGSLYLMSSHNEKLLSNFLTKAGNPASWLTASQARFSFWMGGLKIFFGHPWVGSGLDTFGRAFPTFQQTFFWYSKYPHNFYIQTLSDGGLFTFLSVAGLLMVVLRSGFRVLGQGGESFPLGLGLFFGFLGGMLHVFLDVDSNFLLWSAPFWTLGGLLVSLDERRRFFKLSGFGTKAAGAGLCWIFFGLAAVAAASASLDSQAQRLVAEGKVFEALGKETLAIHCYPWESTAFEHRARQKLFVCGATAQKKWCAEAREDLEHALQIDPVRPLYLGELAGLLSSAMRETSAAETLLKKAIRLDSLNYPLHYVQLADLKLEEGDVSQAERWYSEVIRRNPEAELSRLPSFRRGDFQTAVALAHVGLAKIALRGNKTEQSRAEIRQALQIQAENPQANDLAGLFAAKERKWSEAERYFEKAVFDPGLGYEPWKWLAFSRIQSHEPGPALEALKKAFVLQRKDAELFVMAGEIYDTQGNRTEALKMWRSGLKMSPGSSFFRGKLRNGF